MYPDLFNRILIREKQVLDRIKEYLNLERGAVITYFGVHSFNLLYEDSEFKSIIEDHFDVYSDGIGMYWLMKFIFREKIEKFNASDLNEKVFEYLGKTSQKAYIIGGRFNEEIVRKKLDTEKISAVYTDGYDSVKNTDELLASIDQSGAKIVIIGMGVSLQEKLAFQLFQKDPRRIYICVGGFLEFYFGTIPRIPVFFRNKGVEWLFRIIVEPRRLWKRYLLGIPVFICRSLLFLSSNKIKAQTAVYSADS